jgi:hypothetical protein
MLLKTIRSITILCSEKSPKRLSAITIYDIMAMLLNRYPAMGGGDCMNYVISFLVAVAGGVACHYIIKWLDGDDKSNE